MLEHVLGWHIQGLSNPPEGPITHMLTLKEQTVEEPGLQCQKRSKSEAHGTDTTFYYGFQNNAYQR